MLASLVLVTCRRGELLVTLILLELCVISVLLTCYMAGAGVPLFLAVIVLAAIEATLGFSLLTFFV